MVKVTKPSDSERNIICYTTRYDISDIIRFESIDLSAANEHQCQRAMVNSKEFV
jgi:hypothetical protein